jgi:rRNA-processing protein FCF1
LAIDRVRGDKVTINNKDGNCAPRSLGTGRQIVILDTNGILMLFQFKINLESELNRILGAYDIIIPSVVVGELKNLTGSVPDAKASLKLAEKYGIYNVEAKKGKDEIDNIILELAQTLNAIVMTNDKALRRKLKDNGLRSIYLKSRSHLKMD